ncbi:MAG TPA: serine/threonine-protein kinase [Gemmatimonadales bacterium]|nr:serine/threonine-protein kinase [Gemmatimonadales bacterium]
MEVVTRLLVALADRYTLEREIGRGGWAMVFLARRAVTDSWVAVKVLRPEFARLLGAHRFHREIALLARLNHPNVLPLTESGQAGDLPYYVMPYAAAGSLRDRLEREPQLPLADVVTIVQEVAAALDYAHANHIVHRDIKPDNVLFMDGRAVVSDFGIARAMDEAGGERLSSSGLVAGTPEYMSPEQAAGQRDLDGRTDIYGLGCMTYEMLAGCPPFCGATLQAIVARRAHAPPPLRVVRPDVPEHVEQAILAALARRPEDRPWNGAGLVESLVRV